MAVLLAPSNQATARAQPTRRIRTMVDVEICFGSFLLWRGDAKTRLIWESRRAPRLP